MSDLHAIAELLALRALKEPCEVAPLIELACRLHAREKRLRALGFGLRDREPEHSRLRRMPCPVFVDRLDLALSVLEPAPEDARRDTSATRSELRRHPELDLLGESSCEVGGDSAGFPPAPIGHSTEPTGGGAIVRPPPMSPRMSSRS